MDNNTLERELVIRLLNGDESAFAELYASYKGRLIYFAMKFVKSKQFAEDVFQDAFISVWLNRRFLNPNMPFSAYIYTIVKNRILNLMADMDRENELKKNILSQSIDFDNETEDGILYKDLNSSFEKAIDKLTPRQKQVFEMSRKDMKSHKEIADELHISVLTVQQHISDSIQSIRSYLSKYADTYIDLALLLFCLNL
ncbi:MAG: RNA polymerase sigma-70 factor [Tannerella sp.]|jgi:RNA polymerase sigma-70 factor (ECF subfamily)|nr:RNA polymerase sigma-70 factor [Tannerella sp.]